MYGPGGLEMTSCKPKTAAADELFVRKSDVSRDSDILFGMARLIFVLGTKRLRKETINQYDSKSFGYIIEILLVVTANQV